MGYRGYRPGWSGGLGEGLSLGNLRRRIAALEALVRRRCGNPDQQALLQLSDEDFELLQGLLRDPAWRDRALTEAEENAMLAYYEARRQVTHRALRGGRR